VAVLLKKCFLRAWSSRK